MRHFDLHADTLSKCLKSKKSLIHNDFAISVERGLIFDEWVQVFAAFVPDEYHGSKGYHRFLLEADQLTRAFEESDQIVPYDKDNVRPGVCNAMLAVEGGSAMGGKVSRIDDLYNMGVRMFSLCWNGETDLAGGTASEMGLTTLGKEAVRELEAHKIIIDVSHMNNYSFWDLCDVAERPFIASHSNCFEMCPHRRNLDDLQLSEIIRRGGLIGINFYPVFINGESDASFQELRRHIRHIIALGGEDCIAVGSDFDGAAMPSKLPSINRIPDWHANLLKHFDPELVEKITFKNAQRFMQKNL